MSSGARDPPPAYKLILCDYIMAGMSGPETAWEMRRLLDQFKEENPDTALTMPYICCFSDLTGKD